MAVIAFLLLIFFLVSTTIFDEKGLTVRLPEWHEKSHTISTTDKAIYSILINDRNQIMLEQNEVTTEDLSNNIYDILTENGVIDVENLKLDNTVISLSHDRGTSYASYIDVYNSILKSYRRIWNQVARTRYKSEFQELSDPQKSIIKSDYPMIISEAEPSDF